jgi:hypothetical protein
MVRLQHRCLLLSAVISMGQTLYASDHNRDSGWGAGRGAANSYTVTQKCTSSWAPRPHGDPFDGFWPVPDRGSRSDPEDGGGWSCAIQ